MLNKTNTRVQKPNTQQNQEQRLAAFWMTGTLEVLRCDEVTNCGCASPPSRTSHWLSGACQPQTPVRTHTPSKTTVLSCTGFFGVAIGLANASSLVELVIRAHVVTGTHTCFALRKGFIQCARVLDVLLQKHTNHLIVHIRFVLFFLLSLSIPQHENFQIQGNQGQLQQLLSPHHPGARWTEQFSEHFDGVFAVTIECCPLFV